MNKLPSGWKIEKLENIALVERGKFSVRPRNDPRYFGGNMPFVQTGDISSAKTYLTKYTQTLNEQGISVSKVFPKDTILITIAANIGDTAITTFDVACPDSVVAIQPYKDKANVFWLKQVLETKKAELDAQSTQNAQKNINLQVLKPLIIKTPPLEEQIQIAETLSTWDKAIQTTEKLLENSRQQKKALMQRLLGNEKRRNWKKVIVSEICNIGRGRVISKKEIEENQGIYPVYSSQTLDNGIMGCINSFDFNGEYVTWTTDGVNAGTVFYRNGKFNCTNVCGVLSSKIAELDLKFLAYILSTETYKYVSHTLANPKLMNGIMGSIELELPAIQEQQKIAEILSTADQEIETLQRKLECLKLEKGALMQKLLR